MKIASTAAVLRILCLLTLLALAGAYILPSLSSTGRSPSGQTRIALHQIAFASRMYFETYGSWPTGISNLYRAGNNRHELLLADSPAATNDAWHHPIQYQPFDAALGYGRVISLGRDGKTGGSGFDRDIELRFTTNEDRFIFQK